MLCSINLLFSFWWYKTFSWYSNGIKLNFCYFTILIERAQVMDVTRHPNTKRVSMKGKSHQRKTKVSHNIFVEMVHAIFKYALSYKTYQFDVLKRDVFISLFIFLTYQQKSWSSINILSRAQILKLLILYKRKKYCKLLTRKKILLYFWRKVIMFRNCNHPVNLNATSICHGVTLHVYTAQRS